MTEVRQRRLKRVVQTEELVLYDRDTDCFVTKQVPKSAYTIPFGFDLDDTVRTPILKILRAQEQDRDPRTGLSCIKGNRAECTLYDDLVKVSNRFIEQVPKKVQRNYLNSPERVLLNNHPPFCEVCIWTEHARRRRESKKLRRFVRWLWASR